MKILVDRVDNRNADRENPLISLAKPAVSVNKQPKKTSRLIGFVLIILLTITISCYLLLGLEGMGYDYLSNKLKKVGIFITLLLRI